MHSQKVAKKGGLQRKKLVTRGAKTWLHIIEGSYVEPKLNLFWGHQELRTTNRSYKKTDLRSSWTSMF